MKIIKASVLGFCFGVRRAVEYADKANCDKDKRKNLYTLGPLIHNPCVLEDFSRKGINILDAENISQVNNDSTVIIRAHGTTPKIIDSLKKNGALVIDATCPKVHLSQKKVSEWSNEGYTIFLAGDKNHGEVVSICSYSSSNVIVLENEEQAKDVDVPQKSVLLAQTTFSPKKFLEIENILKSKNNSLLVFNSICSATMERQNALLELKGKADGILVIGGKNSSNTRRLFETAKSIFSRAFLIENENEIPQEVYKLNTVAITAGASTPDYIIDAVTLRLKKSACALNSL